MNKFPKVRMNEIAAVLSCQSDEERLLMLRQVVIRSLTDYYADAIYAKVFILSGDPVTSAQMAGCCCGLITKLVKEKISFWWKHRCFDSYAIVQTDVYLCKQIAKMNEYKMLLDNFAWYHWLSRYSVYKALASVENEPVSLREFLNVYFYKYQNYAVSNLNAFDN